jgi:hypothetical protein
MTQFCTGTGKARLEFKVVWIQVIGAPVLWQDQQQLWRKLLIISHEALRRTLCEGRSCMGSLADVPLVPEERTCVGVVFG